MVTYHDTVNQLLLDKSFILGCGLAWKKKELNNVWDSEKPFTTNFLYEHAEWIAPGNFLEAEFDSYLRIKIIALEVFPHMFV